MGRRSSGRELLGNVSVGSNGCTSSGFSQPGLDGRYGQGKARALFGAPEDGFARLVRDLRDPRPTLVLLAYGNNEAFEEEVTLIEFQ